MTLSTPLPHTHTHKETRTRANNVSNSSSHMPRVTPVPLKVPVWESSVLPCCQDESLFVPAKTHLWESISNCEKRKLANTDGFPMDPPVFPLSLTLLSPHSLPTLVSHSLFAISSHLCTDGTRVQFTLDSFP